MKYFSNITTPEELKKQFRAYCITMHPDKGGDPEEFKTMAAEYNNIVRNFEQAKERAQEEAEARRQAEEYAKAEAKRKAEEEEAARKAAEAMRPVIAKWSAILDRVPEKQRYSKPSEAYSTADNGTASDDEPQRAEECPDGNKNKPEMLNMLKAAARHAEQLTEINEHTEALLALLYVLAAMGLRVRPLIDRVKAIEAAHGRGYLTTEEASERYEIGQEAERKAALYLTPEESRARHGLCGGSTPSAGTSIII